VTRRSPLHLVVALLLVVVGACSSNGSGAAPSSESTPGTSLSSTTSSTVPLAEDPAAAKAAYLAYWQMFDRVTNPPNPADPSIRQFSIDPARADLVDIVTTEQAAGQTFKRPGDAPNRHRVSIDAVANGSATFTDCYVDDGIVLDASGNTVNNKVVAKLLRGRLAVDGGAWKVAQYDVVQRWDGATQCSA
jgi:hypothetical protein